MNTINTNGNKHGYWEEDLSIFKVKLNYKDGIQHGISKRYFKDTGGIRELISYNMGSIISFVDYFRDENKEIYEVDYYHSHQFKSIVHWEEIYG